MLEVLLYECRRVVFSLRLDDADVCVRSRHREKLFNSLPDA